jgi:accessory gene regulator B
MEMENKLKIKTSITERLSESIALKLNKRLKKEGLELMKMKLGFQIIFINLTKFTLIFITAAQLNLLKETMFMSVVFGSLRRSAFGLHAKNSIICTVTSSMIFIFGAHISYYIKLSNSSILIVALIINLAVYKYAPADTENHPLIGKMLRKRLRKRCVITGIILMLMALVVPSQPVKTMIIIAVSSEVVSILPITYKILNRGYKNYEKYEGTIV